MEPKEATIEAALRAAERAYEEEDARFRHTDQKAIALLAFAGVLLTVLARAIPGETGGQATCLSRSLIIAATAGLALAATLGMAALLPRRAFLGVNAADLAKDEARNLQAVQLKRFLIERYTQNIEKNYAATDLKLTFVAIGFWAVFASLMFVAAEGIVRLAL